MLERLCHLKPTINNRKMQEQRQQELKYLKLIGKRGLMPVPAAWGVAILCGLVAILLGSTQGNLGLLFAKGG